MTTTHWTTADIPDQSGRVAVVTGSNTGLGLATAEALAGAGAEVVMAVRNLDKGDTSARGRSSKTHPDANIHLQALDLGSLDSVRSAADDLLDRYDRLDLLINNAGVMYTEWQTTADGFEFQMGVNHLGHFALTNLLLDRLAATEGSRIVNVSSVAHKIKSTLDPVTMMSGEKYDRVARVRPLEARQPAVHLRAAATAGGRRFDDRRARRSPGRLGDGARPQRSSHRAVLDEVQWVDPAVGREGSAATAPCGDRPSSRRRRVLRPRRLHEGARQPGRGDVD